MYKDSEQKTESEGRKNTSNTPTNQTWPQATLTVCGDPSPV